MVYDIDEVCVYVFFMTSTRCVPRCMVGHKFPMILPKENENRLKVRRPEEREYLYIRIQIGMFRPIRVDHTNCLQVDIKTHSGVSGGVMRD